MSTIPGGKVVTNKIPDKKPVASPRGENPQPSKAPGKPYSAAAKPADNYASRRSEMLAHRKTLDAPRSDR